MTGPSLWALCLVLLVALQAEAAPQVEARLVQAGDRVSVGGLEVSFLSRSHKHAVEGGGAVASVELRVSRRSDSRQILLRGEHIRAEIPFDGSLLLIRSSGDRLEVRVLPGVPTPISEDQALDLARRAAMAAGGSDSTDVTHDVVSGVLSANFRVPGREPIAIRVGMYTRAISEAGDPPRTR